MSFDSSICQLWSHSQTSAAPNTGLCNLGESHPLLCWANHLRKKGNSLCLPQPALQQKLTDLLPHTPQQKHTSSGKPMELEASTEGSASAAAALLKLPCELSHPLCCSEALPSSAIQQFCHSAHQCHTSNNVSHTKHEVLK